MNFQIKKTVLLTGAGFTQPFRGLLAEQMFSAIYNRICGSLALRTEMKHWVPDYEGFYDHVLKSIQIEDKDKKLFETALRGTYEDLDENIREQDVSLRNICTRFFERFSGSGREEGFVFTLNQDLFVERWCSSHNTLIKIPGIDAHPDWFTPRFTSALQNEHWIELPDITRLEKNKKYFYTQNWGSLGYVKLHGSYGWRGKYPMIIGKRKTEQMKDEPLINWWSDLFQEILKEAANLVVVGYSFRDEHINNWILQRMSQGLNLHVVNPKPMEEFRDFLLNLHGNNPPPQPVLSQMQEIWEKLGPYHAHSIPDFFVKNHTSLTPEGERVFDSIGV